MIWLRTLKTVTTAVSLIGRGFTGLLRMLVLPLVGISVYTIINSKSKDNLKALTTKSIVYYTVTVFAALIGIAVAVSLGLGKGMTLPPGYRSLGQEKESTQGIVDVVISFIPSNIFKALTQNSVVGLVIFYFGFMGFATNRGQKKIPTK